MTIDSGQTLTIRAPSRAWARSQGSAGSPSSRIRAAYSSIGVRGSADLPVGRTGANTSWSPSSTAFARPASSSR